VVFALSKDKGVSEIIATVLMILIVTVLGFSIFLYGLGFFTATTSANNQATATGIQSLKERFVIVDVSFSNITGGTNVTVQVYNYGSGNLNIVAMYLTNGSQVYPINITSPTTPPIALYPNNVTAITGNTTFIVPYGIPQAIRVVSSLGNYYENDYQR
jgi:flagellin-like protein